MEQASKALLIAGSILIGLVLFAIFVFELNYVSNISKEVNDKQARKEILEFNSQFESYANKKPGYIPANSLNHPSNGTISMHELISLINMTRNWNKEYPHDQIKISIINMGSAPNASVIMGYINGVNKDKPLENLILNLQAGGKDIEQYYFIFKTTIEDLPGEPDKEGIKYNNLEGRISEIRLIGRLAPRELVIPTPEPSPTT